MPIDIEVVLGVADLDEDDPSFELAVQEFISDAREAPKLELEHRKPASEDVKAALATKGGVLQELVLIASAPSSAATVVSLVRLWLKRDRHRSISLKIRPSGKEPVTVEASGDNLSLATLEKVIDSTFRDLG